MNEIVDIKFRSVGDDRMSLQFIYDREYYENDPEQNEVLDGFFGIDFLRCEKTTTDTQIIFTIETKRNVALDFLNAIAKKEEGNSGKNQLGLFYTHNN